ncbi:hypothetical protein GMRT_15626 [Giardia muris]|uniref:Uncharacterized protein n=1 Tax=Giardia muris TaxID=5742 RepID=A0A4Z1T474_GIAMU|nr:hypothetical protein GMRT_15626 [Giardia muris]|eukprot:TNJ28783.1 hypothetical protein GMRT_15626 [Giardia muris]
MLAARLQATRANRDVLSGIAANYQAFRLECACAAIRTALEAPLTARALGGARQACASLGSLGTHREYAGEIAELHEFIRLRTLRDKLVLRREAELTEKRTAEAISLLNGVVRRASERFTVGGDAQAGLHQGILDILLLDDQSLKAGTFLASQGKLTLVDMSLSLGLYTAVKDALTRGSTAFCELLWRQPQTAVRLLFYLLSFSQGPVDSRRLLQQLEMLLFRYAMDQEKTLLAFFKTLDVTELEVLLPDVPSTTAQKILAITQRISVGVEAQMLKEGQGLSKLLTLVECVEEEDIDPFLEASSDGTLMGCIDAGVQNSIQTLLIEARTETGALQERLIQRFADGIRKVLSEQFSKPLHVHFDTHFDITQYQFRMAESQALGRLVGRLHLSLRRIPELKDQALLLAEDSLMRLLHSSRFVTQTVVFEIDPDASRERKIAINRLGEYLTLELGTLAIHAQHFQILTLLSLLHVRELGGDRSDSLEFQKTTQKRKLHKTLRMTTVAMLKQAMLEPELLPGTMLALRDYASHLSWHPIYPDALALYLQASIGASILEAFFDVVLTDEKAPIALIEVVTESLLPESIKASDSTVLLKGVYRAYGNEYPEYFEGGQGSEATVIAGIASQRLQVFRYLTRADLQEITRSPDFLGVWTPQEAIRLLRRRFRQREERDDLSYAVRWLKAHHSAEPRP